MGIQLPLQEKICFLLDDHLGSTSVVANADGSLNSKQLYKPCPLAKNALGCSVRVRHGIPAELCPPITSSPGRGRLDRIVLLWSEVV